MTNLEQCFKLEDEGKPQAAEQCYLRMLAIEPNNPLALYNFGRFYRRYGIRVTEFGTSREDETNKSETRTDPE